MTVQAQEGPIYMGPNDFQRTDKGINWGIKCRDIAGFQIVMIVERQEDGSWSVPANLDDGFDINKDKYTDMLKYLREVILPRLNAWLKQRFGKSNEEIVLTKFEQLDKMIQKITISTDADGYLVASV